MDSFTVNKVYKTTVTSAVMEEFMRILIEGSVKPGDKIPTEQELVKMLGVGRSSVREVLAALELIGIIERRAGDGTYITDKLNSKTFSLIMTIVGQNTPVLFEARKVIEIGLASLAAEKATSADVEQLELYLREMKAAIANQKQFIKIDLEFHLHLATMSQNVFLQSMMLPLTNFLNAWREKSARSQDSREKALAHHTKILEKIKAQDPSGASAAMFEHLNQIQESFLNED